MKHAAVLALALAAACGGTTRAPIDNRTAGGAHVKDDVDGDGQPDTVTLADGVVTMGRYTLPVPADFTAAAVHVVDLGPEAVVVIDSEVVEDDLAWRILQFQAGQLHDLGDVFLGNQPQPGDLPGDGTIHASTGNCGQTTNLVYTVRPGRIEKREETTGAYDASACAACPYVLVDAGAGPRFVGEALRNLSSPDLAAEDALALPVIGPTQRELVVILEEVKAETTHLDAIAVAFDGVRVAPRACGDACTPDGEAEVFGLAERRRFVFDVPPGFAGAPVLYARGYYRPYAPGVRTH